MKHFSLRLAVAAIYLFTSLAHAFGPSEMDMKVAEEMVRRMGPGSSIDMEERNFNGIITHTVRVRNCNGEGNCRLSTYRTSRTPVSIENKHLVVETVDRRSANPHSQDFTRLNFKVSPMPAPASASSAPRENAGSIVPPMNPEATLSIDLNPHSSLFNELKQVAPSIAGGLYDGYMDMQASAQVAAQMQSAYTKTMEAYGRASDHLVDHAERSKALGQETAEQFQVLAASAMTVPVQSINASADYRDYVQTALDPFSFREYELTEATKAQFKTDLSQALNEKNAKKVVELGKTLLQQRNREARESAERELSPLFRDGIVKTQALGSKSLSVVDVAKYKTYRHSASGQIIRGLANKAQVDWISSNGLTNLPRGKTAAYTSALVALQAADESFSKGRTEDGLYLSEVTNTLLDFANGFVDGGVAGISEAVQAIPVVASALKDFTQLIVVDPNAAADKLVGVVASIPGVAEAMAVHYLTIADKLATGTAAERGRALGQIGSEVLMIFATEGAAAAAKGGLTVASTAIKATRAGQMAAALGGAAMAPAVELTQQLSVQSTKVLVGVAKSNRALAVDVLKASRALGGASEAVTKEYLDFVGTQSTRLAERLKSTVAVTDAIQSGVITNSEQLSTAKAFVKALDEAPHQLDLRQVGTNGKVGVIGRSMDTNVLPIAKQIEQHGFSVETFQMSEDALENWNALKLKYPNGVPADAQRMSVGYAENQQWVLKLKNEGYTVIDANNPAQLGQSVYYDELERGMFPRGKR